MSTLTNEDKISIINQRKRNLDYAKYHIEMSILEENAIDLPNESMLDSLNKQMLDVNKKIKALDDEIASLG